MYVEIMGMAVLSLMLVSQSAMAFNPQATVSWSRLNRDPYNWTYTAKVYADRYDSTIKARIEEIGRASCRERVCQYV